MSRMKMLIAGLILSSLFGYLEWGGGKSMLLYQAELEILSKIFNDPMSVLHPFTVLPMLGQALLLISLFQQNPSKVLVYIGIGCIGVLLLLMFAIGIMAANVKILGSTLPFLILAGLLVLGYRRGAV